MEYWDRRRAQTETSLRTAGAIHSRGDAQINPYAFTLALLNNAVERGLKILSPLQVAGVDERADEVLVKTEAGVVQCRAVVYATGYETKPHVQQSSSLDSTYATVSQPNFTVEGWPDECLIWETARPYFYARRTPDGRAMIGGGDTEFANDHERDALVERKIAQLVRRFEQLFPGSRFEPAYSWAGTFASTKDGLAYIGKPPDRPRAYFALGYGGNGITFSMIAAKLITDLYFGRPNSDAEVFRFGR